MGPCGLQTGSLTPFSPLMITQRFPMSPMEVWKITKPASRPWKRIGPHGLKLPPLSGETSSDKFQKDLERKKKSSGNWFR